MKFPLADDEQTSLVVWTTTPWTLPSNTFAAVGVELDYAVCLDAESGERLIVAEALVEGLAEKTKREWTVERTMKGAELVGKRYLPPTETYSKEHYDAKGKLKDGTEEPLYWRVVPGDFVTLDSGTGLVHIAPAFGEVDYELLVNELTRFDDDGPVPGLFCAVGPDGKFTSDYPEQEGVWVKDADKGITRSLKENGRLLSTRPVSARLPVLLEG